MSAVLTKLATLVGVDKSELDDVRLACGIVLGPEFERWEMAGIVPAYPVDAPRGKLSQ